MADKDSFSFDIKTSVGVISESSKGWTKELNPFRGTGGKRSTTSGNGVLITRNWEKV